jgi:histidinol-phosphate aminotransferase
MSASENPAAGLLRPEVLSFTPYSPGLSIEEIKERYNLSQVVKLASNENPLGASPVVQQRIKLHAGMVFRYPQSGNPRLVSALAARLGVGAERVVVGNGSDELIDLILRVRVRPEEEVLAFEPCFSMYKLQSRLCGVGFRQVPLDRDFGFPWSALLEAANERTAVVFVTSPDNPSGRAATADELAHLARSLPRHCLLVVDEAYIDFATPQEEYSLLPRLRAGEHGLENVVLLRTFSKMFGLAGLRLGYGVFPDWLADYLWRVRMPFSVNILAEEAGLAALEDQAFYQASLDTVMRGRELLTRELTRLGCAVTPSKANFLLFRLPEDSGLDPNSVFEALLRRGVIIRPLKSYNLPEHLRVSVGNAQENGLFLRELEEILQAGSGQ